jgi:hypothetical protein
VVQIKRLVPGLGGLLSPLLVPPASSPCRTLGLVAIMPSWPPNWSFIWGIPDQLGLTAADDAKKLQFQMNVFWLKSRMNRPQGRTKT